MGLFARRGRAGHCMTRPRPRAHSHHFTLTTHARSRHGKGRDTGRKHTRRDHGDKGGQVHSAHLRTQVQSLTRQPNSVVRTSPVVRASAFVRTVQPRSDAAMGRRFVEPAWSPTAVSTKSIEQHGTAWPHMIRVVDCQWSLSQWTPQYARSPDITLEIDW
jgi:hypothetical protein